MLGRHFHQHQRQGQPQISRNPADNGLPVPSLSPSLSPVPTRTNRPARPSTTAVAPSAVAIAESEINKFARMDTSNSTVQACSIKSFSDTSTLRSAPGSSERRKAIVCVTCLLIFALAGILGTRDDIGPAIAQVPPPTFTPTFTPTPVPFAPPRNVAGDYRADVAIGKPDFNTIAPNEVTDYRLNSPHGVLVSTNTNGNGGQLFVFDANNNRILVADVSDCMTTISGSNCHASKVIGQPNMATAGCNHDSGFQQFPIRAAADDDTLCTQPEYTLSVSETSSGNSMALDNQGRLFVADFYNHRVLRYPNLFVTPTPVSGTPTAAPSPSGTSTPATPTPIRADRVIGQADFHGNQCNRSQPISLAEVDHNGETLAPAPAIPSPGPDTLCFDWGHNSNVLNNNWIAGVDIDAEGNLWVADSGNNRVLRFPYDAGTDTFSPNADRVLGQPNFESRDPGLGLNQLSNPSVVRVDKRTGDIYVIDQGFIQLSPTPTGTPPVGTATPTPPPYAGNNQYQRVLVFGPTIIPPPPLPPTGTPTPVNPNYGRIFGYFHQPWGLDFDIDRPDNLWVNVYRDSQQQAWKVPVPTASPSLAQILGFHAYLGTDGSIGIDNYPEPLPAPLDKLELIFASTSNNGYFRNDVVVYGVPRSPTPLPGPSTTITPIGNVFGYGGSQWGNQQSNKALAEGSGVAVSSNPIRPQLFASDNDQILFWDNPTTSLGAVNVVTNQAGTRLNSTAGTIQQLEATKNYLYVTAKCCYGSQPPSQFWVDVYQLPVTASSTPVRLLNYPEDFVTVQGTSLAHAAEYDASLFVAPTSDDQFLWVGVTDDSRVLRTRINPSNPNDPNNGKVDIILGQEDAYNVGCNCQKVSNWTNPNLVTISENTVQRTGTPATPTGTPTALVWDAGARSLATISAPEGSSWNSLKGYAQITIDQLGTSRAFGLRSINAPPISPTPTSTPTLPQHDYHNIDYAFVLSGANTLQAYVRGSGGSGVIQTGTYSMDDRLRVAIEIMGGDYHYRVRFYKNSTIFAEVLNVSPSFPYYFEASIASPGGRIFDAYLAASQHQNMTDSTLCLPGSIALDRLGNLWVSDHSIEAQGNMRLLEYDANLFPSIPLTTVVYALPATRIYPNLGTFQPAFNHENNLLVGYNWYTDYLGLAQNPLPPTPLPGTPTPDADFQARFRGRFPGLYANPLYPLPSHTATPAPTSSPSATSTPTMQAPNPTVLLADLLSLASQAIFDEYDNLYVRDSNRSRVMIYGQPGHGTPVTWTTPLVSAVALPDPNGNSIQKTSGTDEVWDAGAVSEQAIGSGDGYVMISVEGVPTLPSTLTPTPTGTPTIPPGGLNTRRAFGLSSSSRFHAHRLQDLDFAFVLTGTNSLDIYEHGAYIAQVGTYNYYDVLKVAVEGASGNPKVVYYQNGGAVYTSTNPLLQYPLQLDTSIATLGGMITNAFISADDLVTCSASGWCTGAPKNGAGAPPPNSVLNGVSVISPNDIWAVGGYYGNGTIDTSIVEHWDGTNWIIATSENVGILHGISAAKGNSGWQLWAVGDLGVLQYNPQTQTWPKLNGLNGGNGIYAKTTTDVWTVGFGSQGMQHWNGTGWTTYSLSAGYTINGVTSTGGSDAWAVGTYSIADPPGSQAIIMHWNGSAWSTVTAPSPGIQASLAGVDSYNTNHVWAVGNYFDAQGHSKNLTEYWNGTQWTQISAPNSGLDSELQSVHITGEGSVWAVGDNDDLSDPSNPNSPLSHKTSILWWNGASWSMEETPSPGLSSSLVGLASTAGALASSPVITGTWVVGSYIPTQPYNPTTPLQSIPSQTLVEFLTTPRAPVTTTTYYETSISQSQHYTQGCAAGTAREAGIIVLDYGQPRLWNPGPSQLYGTLLTGSQDKAYITDSSGTGKDITTAVEKFIQGYADCQPQSGIPIPPPPSYASIAIGTNNNNLDGNAALTSGHAQAWANMVKAVQGYIVKNDLSGYVDVQGAIDLEPDWSTYSLAHDWASAYSNETVSYLYNYGSTDGYPAVPLGEPTPVVPPLWSYSNWDSKQLYHLSGGLDSTQEGVPGMSAVPQILQITLSKEWHAVTSWAVNTSRLPLQFAGEASASTLCPSITNGPGTGQCYTPQQAWQVFFHELSQQPQSGVPQLGDWSTDIKCSNGSTNQSCK